MGELPRRRSWTAVRSWTSHVALACVLVVACTGQIGDGGSVAGSSGGPGSTGGGASGGSSGASSGGAGASSGTGASSSGAASSGGTSPDAGPMVPFDPLPVPSYVTKVKTLLTGMAPTQAEIDAVNADPTALSGLVDTWMTLPQYSAKMELFFADAFQQSQAQALGFVTQLDDGSISPFDELLQNFRQSFAKTVTALIAEGRPFTETATTTRYMMTTAMMQYYAYADSSLETDATSAGSGSKKCRFYDNDQNWSFKLTARDVPLQNSGDPTSPDYLVFTIPNLSSQYSYPSLGAADGPSGTPCAQVDPVVFTAQSSFAQGDNLCNWLENVILGGNFWFFTPPQGNPNAVWCQGASKFLDRPSHPRLLTAQDYTDWRMVTINQATSMQDQTRFFDIVGLRNSTSLTLFEQRVGYFTTPAFLSQYPTNISNQGRVTIDQTMIVGLSQAFDGTDTITTRNAPGLDPTHATNPACFQCHWNLEPMARYFRSNLTMNYSAQQDPKQTGVTGTFLFDNVVANADTSLYYLAGQIAAHARFPLAWTLKLCAWANSGSCVESDPEVQRIAGVFASSNFSWNKLVHELFTSPVVTDASPTLTATTKGTFVPIARRAQLCATLSNRLSVTDVCGYNIIPLQFGSGGGTSALPSPPFCDCSSSPAVPPAPCGKCVDPGPIPPAAAQLPTDGYSRGVAAALYINGADPFYRSSVEQICAYVADQVVDTGATTLYSSASASDVTTSITSMVHGLMGLDSSRDAQPISILTDHYQSATSGGSKPTDALKSTFTVACLSPWVVAVGE